VADESKFGLQGGSGSGGAMRCEEWEAQLTDALDGLLPASQEAAFHAHGETCANCSDLLAHVKQGQEWLGYLQEEPEIPWDLVGRILEKTVGAGGVPVPLAVAGAGAGVGGGAVAMATPWRRSFHETRLLMTVAMAFFSIAMTLDLMGVKPGNMRLADLKPSQIGNTISRQFYTGWGSMVRYYDHLRFVYELESRTRELRRDIETQPQQQQPQNQQQQQKQQPSKPGNGSAEKQGTGHREQGAELRAGSGKPEAGSGREAGSGLGAGSLELGAACGVQGTEQRSAIGERVTFQLRASSFQLELSMNKYEEAAVVLESVETGTSISLGQSGTGLQEEEVEGSLV